MTLESIVYTLAFCSACTFFARFKAFNQRILIFLFCAILGNLPVIYHLSLVEWIDSILGQPSIFLLLLSLSACFVIFYAPRETLLPARSKAFIVICGFVVFLGSLNLLWGFDLFALNFESQLIVVLGILFFALSLDLFLGILYLACLIIYAFNMQENVFFALIDVGVWLYALIWLIIEGSQKRKRY